MEPSVLFVVCMGLGIVFFGLISIIFLTWLMSTIIRLFQSGKKKEPAAPDRAVSPAAAPAPAADPVIANRQEFIAAVAAAIAEDLGTDVSGLRITSVKRV